MKSRPSYVWLSAAGVAVVSMLGLGCGEERSTESPAPASADGSLVTRAMSADELLGVWDVEEIEGEGALKVRRIPWLSFAQDGQWNGKAVNHLGGTWSMSGDRVTIKHGMSTMMGGSADEMRQERRFLDALRRSAFAERDAAGRLVLRDEDRVVLLVASRR